MKAVLVTRHTLLRIQEESIRKAGLKIVKTILQVPVESNELQKFIAELKSEGVEAIVTTGLPPHLIAQLQNHFTIYVLKSKAILTTEKEEEAKKLYNENTEKRFILLGEKSYRVMEFVGLYKVRVQVEEEPVVVV